MHVTLAFMGNFLTLLQYPKVHCENIIFQFQIFHESRLRAGSVHCGTITCARVRVPLYEHSDGRTERIPCNMPPRATLLCPVW